jgi:predicted GNAT family acetyltransferase
MQLTKYTDASDFLTVTQATLEEREAANNLILGVCNRLVARPDRITRQPYLATVHEGDALAAAAAMTPPFGVVVQTFDADPALSLKPIADDLAASESAVPFVNGETNITAAFLTLWQARTGAVVKQTIRQRVYELSAVTMPRIPPGVFRPADGSDVSLIADWIRAFQQEALPNDPHPDGLEWAQAAVGDGDVFVWETGGRPVSMARRGRQTTHGTSIGAVYTPPQLRGRGYASAVVAALSQRILDDGKRFVMLFTDLANPTSNSIYQKIGYRPVCDFTQHVFA